MTTTVKVPAHGTQYRYKGPHNGSWPPCRCDKCTRAHSQACTRRALAHLADQPPLYPAEPIRQHIRTLNDAGMSNALIARQAGVSAATVGYAMRGLTNSVQRDKALRILGVTAGDFDIHAFRPATGTTRRVRALYAIGHIPDTIAAAAGLDPTTINHLANGHYRSVVGTTAAAVAAAYKTLSVRAGTSTRTRRRAALEGWHGPLDWDDIDNPDARPDLGEEPAVKAPAELQPCGTPAAYRRHLRRKEPIDPACREANRLALQERDARMRTKRVAA